MFVALKLVLLLVATLMSFWLPYYREPQKVIQKIRDLGGKVEMETGGPEWLRQFVGNEELQEFRSLQAGVPR